MEFIEEEALSLALLLIRKAKVEKKLRQTFKCVLRKLFSCCGLKNLEVELKSINEELVKLNRRRTTIHRKLSIVSV